MHRIYITTAIPYVNAQPHIGFALEAVQADAIARYHKLLGHDVLFASGSDENSLKNVQAAEAEGISIQELVDKYAECFKELKPALNLSYDIFNRTALPEHFAGAQKLWSTCKKEDIYKRQYSGLYCVGCEEFYTDVELIEGKCPDHKTVPEKVSEENYFFRLTNYQEKIEELIESNTLKIIPETRRNEVLSFVKQGLRDFSISRSVKRAKGWGVPVPGNKNQVMYVWFDALTTYLTSLGYGSDNEKKFNEYWNDETQKIHVIGKGIIRFHAVYWIAMLLSADLPLPNIEFVHGYVTANGQKISKSLGNTVDPFELVEKYGTDAVRYYLLREIPSYGDGDFSERRFKEVYNADLANGLGNLVARVAKLCEQNNIVITPPIAHAFRNSVKLAVEEFKFNSALTVIWERISYVDRKINDEKPWELKGEEVKKALTNLAGIVQYIGVNLQPFLPETSEKILKQFSGKIKSASPLFTRI